MSNYEWLTLIAVLIGGFWTLSQKLSKIEVKLAQAITKDECDYKRQNGSCPCTERINVIEERIERLHDED